MDPILCSICKKSNHVPEGQIIVVATFAQNFQAKNAIEDIVHAHIRPVWHIRTVQDTMPTLILELHGIKDIVQLQALFIESMCRDNSSLTIEIFSTQKSREKIVQQIQ